MDQTDLKKKLTKEQYHILVEKGTEIPFTGKFLKNNNKGEYYCAMCGNLVFDSETKYESNCGWPAFNNPHNKNAVSLSDDFSHGMYRIEVSCGKCGGHLGHVFDDPSVKETGKWYCINSGALDFKDKEKK